MLLHLWGWGPSNGLVQTVKVAHSGQSYYFKINHRFALPRNINLLIDSFYEDELEHLSVNVLQMIHRHFVGQIRDSFVSDFHLFFHLAAAVRWCSDCVKYSDLGKYRSFHNV